MSPHSVPDLPPYADLEAPCRDPETSRVRILPVPLERTVSYGLGTADGPAALLRASAYMEVWDEELGIDPSRAGITTLPALTPDPEEDLGDYLDRLEKEAERHMRSGRFLAVVGGEHSLTSAPVRAARTVFGEVGVVQFDAHADLRDSYEGTPLSHASVMHRVLDAGVPALGVGIRSLSPPEAQLVRERELPMIWGHQLGRADELFGPLLAKLPEKIYLTFDIDYFDPSLVPATGTPEPGGGLWYPTLRLLRRLFAEKTVVAMDLVELAPRPGEPASDFLAAKLLYKAIGYWQDAG